MVFMQKSWHILIKTESPYDKEGPILYTHSSKFEYERCYGHLKFSPYV